MTFFARFPAGIASMRRALQWAFAGSAGAISALALPPHGLYGVLLFTFPLLVWLLDAARSRGSRNASVFGAGFGVGWWFGFGYFLFGLSWIGEAFLVDAERFAWMVPFVIVLMPAGLALFTAIACAVALLFWRPESVGRVLVLAVALSLGDWVRGTILTGFPWNSFGYAVSESLVLSQAVSIFGLYGMSFLVVAVAASPVVLAGHRPKFRLAGGLAAGAAIGFVVLFGTVRLLDADKHPATDVTVRIVQPSIPQNEKWRPENREKIFSTLLDLSAKPYQNTGTDKNRHLLIWPESSIPFLFEHDLSAIGRISEVMEAGSIFLTGAIRHELSNGVDEYYNSIFALDSGGTILDTYDKVRLVPFGEYLPLKEVIESLGLQRLVNAPGEFVAGQEHRTVSIPDLPAFLPLICYEAIFPEFGAIPGTRPGWLLNVTNDAWFGRSAGPYQHFAQARFRSIEQGLPLVRAANTGISAVVDPYGKVVAKRQSFEVGVLDTALPEALGNTVYSKFGNLVFFVSIIIIITGLSVNYYNQDSRQN